MSMEGDKDIDILIVDDSRVIRLTLMSMLSKHFDLREARNGREALERHAERRPDIMILDVNMPEMDGFAVVDHIRNALGDRETFIIVLTAEEDRTVKPRILSLGANDFLAKPFERVELLSRTQVAARQVRLTRELTSSLARLAGELETVGALQRMLLPQASPIVKGLSVDSLYRPSGHASGDYYDYFPLGQDVLRLVVADVSGHGARAACLMAVARTIFHVSRAQGLDLPQTMELLNDQLLDIIGPEADHLTCFAADVHLARHELRYCNAGHCPPLLLPPESPAMRLMPTSPLMGFFKAPWRIETAPFPPGSHLFCYTDGFFEWPMEEHMFGLERFLILAQSVQHRQGRYLENLDTALSRLSPPAPPYRDDCTALWVEALS